MRDRRPSCNRSPDSAVAHEMRSYNGTAVQRRGATVLVAPRPLHGRGMGCPCQNFWV